MDPEKKETATPQASAQAKPEEKSQTTPETSTQVATGLDSLTAKDLQDLYKKSPQMFEGLVKEKEAPKVEPKETPKPDKSAAPLSLDGVEIKLPNDVPVNLGEVEAYIHHAKEIGLDAKQVQAQIDFQTAQARKVLASRPQQKTPEQIDAENVASLKKEFGEKYDENMDIARRAAVEFGDPDLLIRLKTSDPVLVKHLLKIGLKNKEATTPKGGVPRTGNEGEEEEKKRQDAQRQRYPRSPQMFREGPKS